MEISGSGKTLTAASRLAEFLQEILIEFDLKQKDGEVVVSTLLHVLQAKSPLALSDS